ncbi:MAG: M20/M25/M40 family metallo-hydrolase [Gammaproteobacteria bacterium]|nr:M20/M25/M40 family metallo-hydrolase [Gammaproteobacteria bacterium]
MSKEIIASSVEKLWVEQVLPGLSEFIKIPAVSPAYDDEWEANGYLRQAGEQMAAWVTEQKIDGFHSEMMQLEGRSPVLFIDIPGDSEKSVLFYGHMDKMPPSEGWDDGLGPWDPVVRGDKLYGRGGADDGYSLYSAIAAIKALQLAGMKHPRCVLFIEACEESGSFDLAAYFESMREKIGEPELVICLDTSAQDYERLWITSSLRGVFSFDLKIRQLTKVLHSGVGGGIIPDISRVLRLILNRTDDIDTGRVLIESCNAVIPEERIAALKDAADALSDSVYKSIPLVPGSEPLSMDVIELLANKTWRPAVSVIGVSGFPAAEIAGNAMVPEITVRVSVRTPPATNVDNCISEIREKLLANPPYGVELEFALGEHVDSWASPDLSAPVAQAISEASTAYFGNDAVYLGEGGGIGFVPLMNKMFPKAQFILTGLVGPDSNAHAANESLHIPTAKKITCCIAHILQAHCQD